MARHKQLAEPQRQPVVAKGLFYRRRIRSRWPLPLFGSLASLAFMFVIVANPYSTSSAAAAVDPSQQIVDGSQSVIASGSAVAATDRGAFGVTKAQPAAAKVSISAPSASAPDPGTAQAIAFAQLQARGMGIEQYNCLVSLWNRESHWNMYAHNTTTGAYGIPQALPGSKMTSAGSDWATNPATQITWGLGYIVGRYSTPCGAWAHSQTSGWY